MGIGLLIAIAILILIEVCLCIKTSKLGDKILKPKYRIVDGKVEYLCRMLDEWRPITYWDNNVTKRTLIVHDTFHNQKYVIEYEGPGRTCFDSYDDLMFKNSLEIYEREARLIDKENEFIKHLGTLKFFKKC